MPAKPGKAKDLIEADDIGRKAVSFKNSDFHIPHKMLQAN